MKAIAVVPGKPDSVHLAELSKPSVDDVPGGRGVLVKVLRVGVDGTDKEINAAEYGAAPDGHDVLVIGHLRNAPGLPLEATVMNTRAWRLSPLARLAVLVAVSAMWIVGRALWPMRPSGGSGGIL